MKKNTKAMIKRIFFIAIFVMFLVCTTEVFAELGHGLNTGYLPVENNKAQGIEKPIKKVLSTFITVAQIIGVAGIVITGVRYMYAGSESKAKIKQTLVWITIGTIFLFGASRVITFVTKFGDKIV